MDELYISTHVETDGPIPGPNSMLGFASAAYQADKTLVSVFTVNLETLPGAQGSPRTMEWWRSQPEIWLAMRENPQPPAKAMREYVAWLKKLQAKCVFVGYPGAFDFMFMYWYCMRYAGECPFSHSCIDIKSYAMALMKTEYRNCVRRQMPREWFDETADNVVCLQDALSQGTLFCNMMQVAKDQIPKPKG
jgi:hypothetical protein